ncbi:hypothetical protein [Salinisphaera hydrothermalis]|uniref:Uncharacterized protein n=1 Tax=Salinisphaera hydrothermalis (strain C41B8) TaxID=1304275 RepID=A0A084INL1_SALHC|nr:hypothetical protein [Salinisphaera hydrothermalis]KEZ78295.1 hypothetical protein C41B8_05318 [Salinisphaera hydrothermalis C41B8]
MPDYGSLADLTLANAQPQNYSLGSQPPAQSQTPDQEGSILSRLHGLVAQPGAYNRPELSGDDKRRVLLNTGLALMQSTQPGTGGLFANLGRAGQVGVHTANRIADRKLQGQEAARQSEQSYLQDLLGQYNQDRQFDAGRQDAQFNHQATRAKFGLDKAQQAALDKYRQAQIALDRDKTASLSDYRNRKLAQDGRLTDARINSLQAKAQKDRGNGGLKAGQVRLRNGQTATMDDIRQLYNARYGKWDPMSQQYSFGQNAPTLDQFFSQITTQDTDPFSNPNKQATDPLSLR